MSTASGKKYFNDGCAMMQEPEEEMGCPHYGIDCVPDYKKCPRFNEWEMEQRVLSAIDFLKSQKAHK